MESSREDYNIIFKASWLMYVPPALTFQNSTFFLQCIYMFCMDLRTNSEFWSTQLSVIGSYYREGKCLLRSTNWVFK